MERTAATSDDQGAPYRDAPPFALEAAGHRLTFLPGGEARLDALLRLIGESQTSLCMAFYIFAPDNAGTLVRDALAQAARRGVAVTLIIDDFGSSALPPFFAPLVEAGGRFRNFLPRLSHRYLIRNHQKLVIADGARAMLGGFNVADEYFAPPQDDGWHDLGVLVEGPVVRRLADWFACLDELTGMERGQFRAILRAVRHWDAGQEPMQVLLGGPTRGLSSWARVISSDLMYGKRLALIMAYFSPPRRLLRRIRRIAQSGEAHLVMAGKSDNGATIGASRLLYRGLLKSRARLWEFQPCKLHTKLIVLDDVVYLGSANFDMRSLYLNLEIVLRIRDAALADRMRQFIAEHYPVSQEITRQVHAAQGGWFNRLRWLISWVLVSVVDYTVTRKLNLGLK